MASPLSFFLTILLLFVTTFASGDPQELIKFSYSGSNGPNKWGSLSPNFSACSNGKSQSPIDIVKHRASPDKELKPLDREYYPANATLVNNGFNIGVRFEGNSGGFSLDGKKYTLLQMHWHSPSEHQIDGELHDAELHLVHKADDGSVSVVAILYKYGDPDPLLSEMQSNLAELRKEQYQSNEQSQIVMGTLNTKQMRRRTRKYYRYIGSFTTPPCTENVIWHILGKVRSISKQQVEALKDPLDFAYKNNSRPVQALNGRKVELYDESKIKN